MYLANNGILPPKQWIHAPELQDDSGYTVAMYIAQYCKQTIPREWHHNPNIK